ncbi:SDR family NAD(P)-dependent oxidoreductase, partial [Alkalihalobacillus pseudalcaliphilus]|uniref:SDR family NAD(P)-dependent oxidoreductase n=1 Tax=Alkalihalobacillus pseudalcaliphilus TaxID=79884 RepID=UPI00064DCCFC
MDKALNVFQLNDKVALVTGAAGGMGTAISKQLATLGATVILTDINEEGVKKSAEQLAEKGLNVDSLKVNILDSESIQEVVSYVKEKYGKLDILVNNAGAANDAKALETSDDEWRKMIAINLDGAFYMSREFGQLMVEAK